jgi:hypothetical protein
MFPASCATSCPGWTALVRVEAEVEPDVFSFEPEARVPPRSARQPRQPGDAPGCVYGDVALAAAQPSFQRGSFAHPDPEDILRYTVRDLEAEQKALALLGASAWPAAMGPT